MAVQPLYRPETQVLCRVARNCVEQGRGFRWTKHALKSLVDGYSTGDYEKMLTNCQVTLVETDKKDILWRAEGVYLDGERLVAIVAVYEQVLVIKVITTFLGR